jgi:hypothetical protein
VTVKAAVIALGAIETAGGTVILPVELKAIVVGTATGLLMVAVQAAAAPGVRDTGVHERELTRGVAGKALATPLAVPPVAVVAIWLPSNATASAPVTPIDTGFTGATRVTVPAMPFAMRLPLMPAAIQV